MQLNRRRVRHVLTGVVSGATVDINGRSSIVTVSKDVPNENGLTFQASIKYLVVLD